jgi:hypothetical protein
MQAIALAAMLGFMNIYITSYDFFSDPNNLHAYSVQNKKKHDAVLKKHSSGSELYQTRHFGSPDGIRQTFPIEMQIKFVFLLKKIFPNVKFLSVTEECIINEYLDLAPIIYEKPWYVPGMKPVDRIQDYLPCRKQCRAGKRSKIICCK